MFVQRHDVLKRSAGWFDCGKSKSVSLRSIHDKAARPGQMKTAKNYFTFVKGDLIPYLQVTPGIQRVLTEIEFPARLPRSTR